MSLKPKDPPTSKSVYADRGGFHAPAKPTRPQLPDDVYGSGVNHYTAGYAGNGYFSPVFAYGDVNEKRRVPTTRGGKKVV